MKRTPTKCGAQTSPVGWCPKDATHLLQAMDKSQWNACQEHTDLAVDAGAVIVKVL